MTYCATSGCNKPVRYTTAGLCVACYSAQVYWAKKTPSERAKRRKKLRIFEKRLEEFTRLRRVI